VIHAFATAWALVRPHATSQLTVSAPLPWRSRWTVALLLAAPFIALSAVAAIVDAPRNMPATLLAIGALFLIFGLRTTRSFVHTHANAVSYGVFPHSVHTVPLAELSDCLLESLVPAPHTQEVAEGIGSHAHGTYGTSGHQLGVRLEFVDTRVARIGLENELHAVKFADHLNTVSAVHSHRKAA